MSKLKCTLILMFALVSGFALADSDKPLDVISPAEEVKVLPPVEEAKVLPSAGEVKLDLTTPQPIVLVELVKPADIVKKPVKKEATKVPKPVIHEVQSGDTLSSIAESHQTAWPRIYDANTEVEDPNLIAPGEKLRIPRPDEQITPRTAPAAPAAPASVPVVATVVVPASELIGSYGYVVGGSNCVNTAKAHGKNQPGNPISWVPTTQAPFIGAAVLFYFNHVAIVSGIHSDGSVEVIHENCPGCPTRYARSAIRGFF